MLESIYSSRHDAKNSNAAMSCNFAWFKIVVRYYHCYVAAGLIIWQVLWIMDITQCFRQFKTFLHDFFFQYFLTGSIITLMQA